MQKSREQCSFENIYKLAHCVLISFQFFTCCKSTLFIGKHIGDIFMKKYLSTSPPSPDAAAQPHLGISFPKEKLVGIFSVWYQAVGHHNPSHFQLVNFQLNLALTRDMHHTQHLLSTLFKNIHIHGVARSAAHRARGRTLFALARAEKKYLSCPFSVAHRGLRRKGKCAFQSI